MMEDTSLLYVVGAKLVGATLALTGIIKAIEPNGFRGHLASLGVVPWKRITQAVSVSAALEAALGAALVVGLFPPLVYPVTIVVLAGFAVITWWSVRSGKVDDCGCYGGYIQPSMMQSIGLNALFATMIILAIWQGPRGNDGWQWKIAAVAGVGILVGAVAEYAQRYAARNGKPLLDRNPLKVGNRWKHSWTGGLTAGLNDEFLVGLLGTECPYCGKFVRVANAMTQSPALPPVFGVVAASEERTAKYLAEKDIHFPVARISQSLMSRLANAVPTAVLVKRNRIEKVWAGDMPPEFVDRFLAAFFPQVESVRANHGQRVGAFSTGSEYNAS